MAAYLNNALAVQMVDGVGEVTEGGFVGDNWAEPGGTDCLATHREEHL